MSAVEEELRAREYRRSTQARMDYNKRLEDATLPNSDQALIEAHEDYDPLIPTPGWDPVESVFLSEEDQK